MNRKIFYDSIRTSLFHGKLTKQQVTGMEAKLDAWEASNYSDLRWLGYMLGTAYHETAKTMYPIEEFGKGKGKRYGKKIKYNGQAYIFPDKIYYGRGDIQLTWYENYELMGKILNIPLLENPDLALDPCISAKIMIEGMTRGVSKRGDFTGVSLEMYFNNTKEDYINARRIINGLDRATLIAEYAKRFYSALITS